MAEEREPEDTRVRTKRRRWWIWLPAWCFGLLLLTGLVWWAVAGGMGRARWKALQAKHTELRTKVLSASPARRPLEGEAVPGNAWKHYEDAAAAYEKLSMKEKDQLMAATYSKAKPEQFALAFAVLETHPEIFAAVREGAKCDTFDPPYQWELGADMPLDWLPHRRLLSRLLVIETRRRRSEGDLDAALDCVALGFQVGADCGSSGVFICWLVGVAARGIVMAQAGPIASDPALTAAQAGRLEKLMERLEDELLPLHLSMQADRLSMQFTILRNEGGSIAAFQAGTTATSGLAGLKTRHELTWRHGYSWRLALAEVDDRFEKLTGCLESGATLAWPDASREYKNFFASVQSDPILDMLLFEPAGCDDSGRSGLARIRLIRALCHERRTGAPENPLPLDPHTRLPLHRRVDPDKTVYWAEGADGDQGGKGEFDPNSSNSGDIVLEWKK